MNYLIVLLTFIIPTVCNAVFLHHDIDDTNQSCAKFIKQMKPVDIVTVSKDVFDTDIGSCLSKCQSDDSSYCTLIAYDEANRRCQLVDKIQRSTEMKLFYVRLSADGNIKLRNCQEVYLWYDNVRSGIFTIYPVKSIRMTVYCDFDTPNAYWMVAQRRINGQLSFRKSWQEYKHGFGNLSSEFWMGNEQLHVICRINNNHADTWGPYIRMRFDLWDSNDEHKYAEYNMVIFFQELRSYEIYILQYNGTAGDSMRAEHWSKFSTYDQDNDKNNGSCSEKFGYGGWWYSDCYSANLNGEYVTPGKIDDKGIIWGAWKQESLKKVEIKVAWP